MMMSLQTPSHTSGFEHVEINPQLQAALACMEQTDHSLFITGKAGTGKSTLLDYFRAHTKKDPVILAPTGVAALNVKGQTIHSFFNFYVDITPEKIKDKTFKPRSKKLYRSLKMLIIDEVSMLRADLLDCIATFLELYGPYPMMPFGGVQMIFVGDLYQLPPVVPQSDRALFETHYESPFFFSAHAFRDYDIKALELNKIYRQKDPSFLELLNRVRNNETSPLDLAKLNTRCHNSINKPSEGFCIHLTTTNQNANTLNDIELEALPGDLYHAKALITGEMGKEYYPTMPNLYYKVGAQIMLLNNDQKRRWVNGTLGIIERIETSKTEPDVLYVKLENTGQVVKMKPFTWEVFRFNFDGEKIISEAIGTFTQYPFRLAWAVTIHKSQGKTFDNVVIDIGRGTFASGQLYVALSRCTRFEGIGLKKPIKRHHIRTDPKVAEFVQTLKAS